MWIDSCVFTCDFMYTCALSRWIKVVFTENRLHLNWGKSTSLAQLTQPVAHKQMKKFFFFCFVKEQMNSGVTLIGGGVEGGMGAVVGKW